MRKSGFLLLLLLMTALTMPATAQTYEPATANNTSTYEGERKLITGSPNVAVTKSALPDRPAVRAASSQEPKQALEAKPEPAQQPSRSAGTGDWFSAVRFARTTPEASQVFCPLHGKMEMVDRQGLRNHPLQLPLDRLIARP